MIVQCPSCSKRYRVNDANIPASGGKIRCPECSHAFVVYPESSSPEPAGHQDPGEKTSVAQRPNMQELLNNMQSSQGQGQPGEGGAGEGEGEVAKTEVMSGTELPDFGSMFGEDGPPEGDQTVEMNNPLNSMGSSSGQTDPPGGGGDDLKTQQLDSDIVQESLGNVRDQVEQREPVESPPESDATQIVPPPNVDKMPSPQNQQRASVPNDPTPPPSQQRASIPDDPTPPPVADNQGSNNTGPAFDTGSGSQQPMASDSGAGGADFGATPAPQQRASSPKASGPAESASQPPPADSAGDQPSTDHDGPWKLKTNFGLTYEFADNDSLRSWLDNRDELDGYELSADGDDFYPLDQFPQVHGNRSRSGANAQMSSSGKQAPVPRDSSPGSGPLGAQQKPSGSGPMQPQQQQQQQRPSTGAGSGGRSPGAGDPASSGPLPPKSDSNGGAGSPFRTASKPGGMAAPPTDAAANGPDKKERIDPNESFQPPSRDSALLNGILWGAFALLGVAAIVLSLQLFGYVDLLDDDEPEDDRAGAVVDDSQQGAGADEAVPEPESAPAADHSAEVERLLDSARGDIESNRLSSALDRLERAEGLDPNQIRLYDMKADVHDELGEVEQAEASRERARELRQQGAGTPPPPVPPGGDDGPAADGEQ